MGVLVGVGVPVGAGVPVGVGVRVAVRVGVIVGVEVPVVTLPVAPGRSLSILIEVGVRNHLQKTKGIDRAKEFVEKLDEKLRETRR